MKSIFAKNKLMLVMFFFMAFGIIGLTTLHIRYQNVKDSLYFLDQSFQTILSFSQERLEMAGDLIDIVTTQYPVDTSSLQQAAILTQSAESKEDIMNADMYMELAILQLLSAVETDHQQLANDSEYTHISQRLQHVQQQLNESRKIYNSNVVTYHKNVEKLPAFLLIDTVEQTDNTTFMLSNGTTVVKSDMPLE